MRTARVPFTGGRELDVVLAGAFDPSPSAPAAWTRVTSSEAEPDGVGQMILRTDSGVVVLIFQPSHGCRAAGARPACLQLISSRGTLAAPV